MNREKEKGGMKYQFARGLCISVRYRLYNSSFIIRSLIKGIGIEQLFNYYALTNIYIKVKENVIKKYKRNKEWNKEENNKFK